MPAKILVTETDVHEFRGISARAYWADAGQVPIGFRVHAMGVQDVFRQRPDRLQFR